MTTANTATSLVVPPQLTALTDEDLIISWAIANKAARAAWEEREGIGVEVVRRLGERKATALIHSLYEVRLETPKTLDAELLRPLAEMIPPDEWERGFTEAHEETVQVPAKADGRVVFAWQKYGADVAAAIDAATVPGVPKLRITPKKG